MKKTLKVYVMSVARGFFEYDEINDAVVVAYDAIQAISLAKKERDCPWDVDEIQNLDSVGVIASFVSHG